MEIKAGMKFKGNVNGREILILKVSDSYVTYQDLKTRTIFTVGRAMFGCCDIQETAQKEKEQ